MHPAIDEALVSPPGSAFHSARHIEDRGSKTIGDDTKNLVVSFSSSSDSAMSLLGAHATFASVNRNEKDADDDTITTASSSSEADFTHNKQLHHQKEEHIDDLKAEKCEPIFRSTSKNVPQTLEFDKDCLDNESVGQFALKRANPIYDSDDDDYYYSSYASPSKRLRQYQEDEDKRGNEEFYGQSLSQTESLFYYDTEPMLHAETSKKTITLLSTNQLALVSSAENTPILSFSEGSKAVPA
eukprot:CAMPEP_0185733172 /NCGR_PEP_ID=MMETSP1171-20130828/18600_1 /TAXON_ID=374046 /ORGANISM="Helicotheca tamensis, Strain CCMP826" /LENGTH=240 /DNA_ID=CAMNT_0028402819 /DNA_START=114 /DNA_END=836 /DNA_ORIENTATION=+